MADNGRTLQIYPQLGARGSASDLTARTIVRVSFDSGTYTSPQIGAYVDLYYSAVSRITRDLDRRVCQGARPDPKPVYGEAGKYDLGTTETFFVYGGIGGVSSAATGQDIGSGFLAGGLSALVPTGSNFEVNLIIKATAGGTISELTGGKFANGATTAAFAYASTSLVSDIKNGASFGEATLDLAGKVWALPNTIIGTVVGLAGVPFGADTRFTNNAIWFENYPLGEGAVTIGNAVISSPGWGANDTRIAYGVMQNIGLHEMGHTFQYQALGPLFFPMYVASGGAFTGSSAFEQGATRYATTSKGWWPWP